MPKFFHDREDAKELFETVAAEKKLLPVVVEKDYWVMHCLWGLQRNGLAFEMKGGTALAKGWGLTRRFSEDLDVKFLEKGAADHIEIPGIEVKRPRPDLDAEVIQLRYRSRFDPIPELAPHVVLETGEERTSPHAPRDFSSWVQDKALSVSLEVVDNRALGVPCFLPKYTFVDKLQTVCRFYRQYQQGKKHPRVFMRHYYDLYCLLQDEEVLAFIGGQEYGTYRDEKLSGEDRVVFHSRSAFLIADPKARADFKAGLEALKPLLLQAPPSFDELLAGLRKHADAITA